MANNFKNAVDKAVWKVSRNLIRDYNELELLNSTNRATENFVAQSLSRAKEIYTQELSLQAFDSIQFMDTYKAINHDGNHIIISPVGSAQNLQRGFPFFSTSIIQIQYHEQQANVNAALISFPALGYIFYAEKGHGAWMETYQDSGTGRGRRLRVSGIKKIEDAVTSRKYAEVNDNVRFSRDFGSPEYEIASFVSGKLDAIIIESGDKFNRMLAEMFTKEAGGFIKTLDNLDLLAINNSLSSNLS